jgi:hypothetical protein
VRPGLRDGNAQTGREHICNDLRIETEGFGDRDCRGPSDGQRSTLRSEPGTHTLRNRVPDGPDLFRVCDPLLGNLVALRWWVRIQHIGVWALNGRGMRHVDECAVVGNVNGLIVSSIVLKIFGQVFA